MFSIRKATLVAVLAAGLIGGAATASASIGRCPPPLTSSVTSPVVAPRLATTFSLFNHTFRDCRGSIVVVSHRTGNIVRSMGFSGFYTVGGHQMVTFTWHGKNDAGNRVRAGKYTILGRACGAGSARVVRVVWPTR